MSVKQDLKILTIGNSFTDSLVFYFADVVKSAGCGILFDRANHGGCELRRHWSYIDFEERDSTAMKMLGVRVIEQYCEPAYGKNRT